MSRPSLPHCQLLERRAVDECVKAVSSGEEQEVFFAVSKDFYDGEHYYLSQDVYPKYKAYFEELASDISNVLGAAAKIVHWESENFPDWAVGERIAIWEQAGLYLRLHHEDREVPILIGLARTEEE